ncbi:SPFH domain-containing protein [Spirilliplanes yamanashiensis]|uniref:Membrane protein n=1 Tax=Spirilliplanes yamanashiensis TaxID=42233 RepID=A0A8J3Y4H6_9ACTN|nr:SPFH domain-containing protein [Spirilliplanes yamanashiensis]MDP9819943.1 regulator of protease activity HflC (stomatin/prohibitin superfamily) [Spirilliplanes yamanashiensis]GIJ01238.1 membrane protein [Spirilliplanes yamanashiensis]
MERQVFRTSGFAALGVLLLLTAGGVLGVVVSGGAPVVVGALAAVWAAAALAVATGLVIVNPNEAQVVQFFGRYVGSIREPGFHWTVPLTDKRRVTLRVRNFETDRLKVSDADGNPVEIAAVVVWRVVDTAKAVFAVDDHLEYVAVQAEAAVRHLATSYPYDSHDPERYSLRDSSVVSDELTTELAERVALAGVEVLESRTTHLAYAPEIAQAMLARQQASAIVGARFKIVEGAVGMVSEALEKLRAEHVVELDEERKAQMVSNLLVVLCGDRAAQPVVNAGTLY